MYSSHVVRPALLLAVVVGMCLVASQASQAILVYPGVVFRMTTTNVGYKVFMVMHFTTISVRAGELVLDQLHLQFSPGAGGLTATFHIINPSVQTGTALSWLGALDISSATVWFNTSGLRPDWTYTVWINFAQVSTLTSNGVGAVTFYWTTTAWDSGLEFALIASQPTVTGGGPTGPLLGQGGGWIILVLVLGVSGVLMLWALGRKRGEV